MYTEIHTFEDIKQKSLYFKLNNAFNTDETTDLNKKFVGLYAIYKDNICLYVGQSTNIASRLSTHIRGKYEEFTKIYVWNIEDIGFSDFFERTKETQKTILDNCEKYLMTRLKPIENLLIDMDFELSEDKTPNIFEKWMKYEDDKGEVTELCVGEQSTPSFVLKNIKNRVLVVASGMPSLFNGFASYVVDISNKDEDKAKEISHDILVRMWNGDLENEFLTIKVKNEN